MKWQPIETAPRDGTEVLFWHRASNEWDKTGPKIGKMERYGNRWVPVIGVTVFNTNWDDFTHWMPLPEPPESEE